ncbi:MAG: 4-hydroxy-tetrahydrodipicolinate synthase [Planctomycetota bacterium]|jgi:4-hydroxy-tetrahydrodipicolinate synthase
MIDLHGAYTALVTPFVADGGAVDLDRLAAHVNRQSLAGVRGVVPCGTTGETPTLAAAEQRAIVETTIEVARPLGLQVVAGAGSNSTAHAIDLHRFAHAAGADAALHVCPYYNKPSQEGLYGHFTAIADSCDLPIVLYNIPGRTGVTMSIETIRRLAAHANIVAIKDATGGLAIAEAAIARTDLAVLSGDDPLTLPLMSIGGRGVVSVLGNVWPDRVAGLCRAMQDGELETARSIHRQILPLAHALLTLDTNPVPVKAAMALLGLDTGAVRLPLVDADESVRKTLASLLEIGEPVATTG